MKILKKIYHTLPLPLRQRFSTLFWKFFYSLKSNFNPFYPRVFIFKGEEKHSHLPLTFAYVGMPSQTQTYWVQAILAPGFQKRDLGRHFWHSLTPLLKKEDCNLFLIENNFLTLPYFSKDPGFNIPRWIDMEIDISNPMEALLGSERSEIERKIRKYQLTYAMTHEQEYINDFYHNMYMPHIQSRYRQTAMLCSHPRVMEMFSKGELILIKKEGVVIAGGLLDFHKNQARFRLMGIKGGNMEYVHQGCIGALYYFIITEMKKRGYKKLHIGGTRPLLSDGLTKFKKSLKANLIRNDRNTRVWLRLLKDAQSLQEFLLNNPFIFFAKDGQPHRAVFLEAKEHCSPKELADTLRVSACKGIENTDVFIISRIPNPADYASLLPGPSLSVESAQGLFSN